MPDKLDHKGENVSVTHYASGINRILSLDALGNKISVLDMDCNVDPKFDPKFHPKARYI